MPPVDLSYRLLAAGFLRKQVKRLARQIDDARKADDPECVHQARVASRRLRAALRMFADCFDPVQQKRWLKEIRRVTERLGDARDRDVQIRLLYGVLRDLDKEECLPGIVRLLGNFERERLRLQPKVIKAADRLQASGVLQEMRNTANDLLAAPGADDVSLQTPCTLQRTGQYLLDGLQGLLSLQQCLADPSDRDRHHAMRIAAKRLRYTAEISAPVYDGQLDEAIVTIKRVQTLLGEIHDCDVWIEDLQAFGERERRRIVKRFGQEGPMGRVAIGIEWLAQKQQQRREQVFAELADYWRELSEREQWKRLEEMVRSNTGTAECGKVNSDGAKRATTGESP
jgi:CHAD domain-containing protein